MRITCPHCGRSVENDPTIGHGTCPHCSAKLGDTPDLHTLVQTLWAGTVSPEAEPGMTLRQPTPSRPEAAATAVAKTIPHDASKDKRSESVASNLQVRPQEVADRGEPREPPAHYEILRVLGEGGMGVVYLARQTSIDRTIALKMIKPEAARERDHRNKFLAEAVVTGELDHPNIVPIHDLGSNAAGALFYAMKQVRGTPWSEAIAKKPLDENLDILMRVADAVAFAHSRGIIHRDLKPSNVMLGDFGEVLLMDWGLAVAVRDTAKGDLLSPETAIGGTPCYMAPEMARGDASAIGPQSDVYLLGAILYQLVTGGPPHRATDTMKCVYQAAENTIEPTDETGELVDIALRAMATAPADRHDDVKVFQEAVREYQRHEQSIVLGQHAAADLERAEPTQDYAAYTEAVAGYQQALKLWPGNEKASSGLHSARLAYAGAAFEKRDFDLALSLLDAGNPEQAALAAQAETAKREREARRKRVRVLTGASLALAAAVLIVSIAGFFTVRAEQGRTLEQRDLAEKALADFRAEQTARAEDRKESAPALVRSARMFAEQGDFAAAETLVRNAIEYDADLSDARVLHTILLLRKGECGLAEAACPDAVASSPDDTAVRRLQAICHKAAQGGLQPELAGELSAVVRGEDMPRLAAEFERSMDERIRLYGENISKAWPEFPPENIALDEMGRLRVDERSRRVTDLAPLRGIPLQCLHLQGSSALTDLDPLRGMPLEELRLLCGAIDLSPLSGMPLTEFVLAKSPVTDLTPLTGTPVTRLGLNVCVELTDLRPLRGLKLVELSLAGCIKVADLSPLEGMPLRIVSLENCGALRDLTPLRGLGVEDLSVRGIRGISDLSPPRGTPLRVLDVSKCAVLRDLSPLGGLELESLAFTPKSVTTGIEAIRQMKSLNTINSMPAAEFWKRYDAGESTENSGE